MRCVATTSHARAKCAARQQRPASASANPGAVFKQVCIGASAAALLLATPGDSWANREKVGEFAASGFLFKDTVEVTAIDDPEVSGITLYISDFKRSIADKLAKDFFTDPSQASLTCVQSGTVGQLEAKRLGGQEGKEVFSERKGISIFKDKTLRVRRIYDDDRDVLVYIAYSTRLTSAQDEGGVSAGRYRTSICAIPIVRQAPAPSSATSAAAPAAAAAPTEAAAVFADATP